jgi:hypothetical protein
MIIDFEMERKRRLDAEWWRVCNQLLEGMMEAALCETALTSATLRALFDYLESIGGLSRLDAKKHIAQSLNEFQEERE